MLRTAERGGDRQLDGTPRAIRDVEPRRLPARVRRRLPELLAPAQHEIVERRLLARLAEGGLERRLALLDDSLREIPVAVAAQQQIAPALRRAAGDDGSGGALRRLQRRSRSVLVRISCTSSTFGPLNISFGGRLECAVAKSSLLVQATKSSKVRHQVFTS